MNISDLVGNLPIKLRRPFYAAYSAALASPGVGGRTRSTFRLGASLYNNALILTAHNSYKTHPILAKLSPFPFQHAESSAILRNGLDNCEGTSLFVCRITRQGTIANAKPCAVCKELIKKANIKAVYYTTEEGYAIIKN